MLRFLLLLITSCAALGPPQVLLVSGSDSGGGAGLQAEIKTCEALGVFSTNAVTAITAQNTVGVHGVHGLPPAFVVEQMDAVFDDFAVDAVKTGLLASVDVVEAVARRLRAADVGGVVVGDVPSMRVDAQPYGGVKDSGIGREGIRYAIEDMTELRVLLLKNVGVLP